MGRHKSNPSHARHQQVPASRGENTVFLGFNTGYSERNSVGTHRMPGSFDEREKGYEAKWVHDEELRFRVFSRRNRMLGLWAAGEMGLRGADAEAYAKDIIDAEFEKDGEN